MILRSVTKHIKEQNWFAVIIDFVIVVIGVFIGIQVANWNDARSERLQEQAVLLQLVDEFSEIKSATEKQIGIRTDYVSVLSALVAGLENIGPMPEDLEIRRALSAARSVGRRPAKSSAYLQLTASGDLARLSSLKLKRALVRYHALLERDAFILPELMRMVMRELTSNEYVDYDPRKTVIGAAIDKDDGDRDSGVVNSIRSYDIEGLKNYEQRYEAMYLLHSNFVGVDQVLLELINEILEEAEKGAKKDS